MSWLELSLTLHATHQPARGNGARGSRRAVDPLQDADADTPDERVPS